MYIALLFKKLLFHSFLLNKQIVVEYNERSKLSIE